MCFAGSLTGDGVITVQQLHKSFAGIHAINGVSLTIERGAISGLIGPNGAGKSTLFNVVTGLYPPDSGTVLLEGKDITALKPHQLFARGIRRTFQIAQEFATLSVRNNLMMVPKEQSGERLLNAWLRPRQVCREEAHIRQRAAEVIEFLNLSSVADELAGNISGGQKKLLELGRTMMCSPKIVFLDEVAAGVNRTLLKRIGDAIIELNREQGYTFWMIEHDMEFIGRLCEPVTVMSEGAILTTGSAAEVMRNEAVIDVYLGPGHHARDPHDQAP